MEPRFEVRPGRSWRGKTRWYFVLIAANGEVVMTSETYTRLGDAFHAAQTVKELAAEAGIRVTGGRGLT